MILYIDTTTSYLYTGIVSNNKLLKEIKEDCGKDLSKSALNKIKEMLDSLKLRPSDLNRIIVVNGPGSFTGIRIGVTIAKTLAYSLNIPIITVSSLEAMMISSDSLNYKVPIIDARRGYVYAAIYDKDNNTILPEQYINLEALKVACDNLIDDYDFIGNGFTFTAHEYNPNILKIVNTFCDRESINPHLVNPIYLKKTEAEENKKEEIL